MNVTVETTPESDAAFHVQVDWPSIEKESEKVYKRLAQTQKIPGFRPGHAPRAMVERIYGRDYLYEAAIETLVEAAIDTAASQQQLTLLQRPHVHVHDMSEGQEQDVTVTVPVLTRGELADYHDIREAQEPVEVTDEDIDRVIDNARERLVEWVPANRPAAMGDRVTVDLKLVVGEKTISDLKDHEFDLVEDRTGLFIGMDQEIVGMSEEETKEFTTTLPEDYGKEEMAGQPANYTVTLAKVTVKELPAIDDDFLKKVGPYDTEELMRADVRKDLTLQRTNSALRQLKDKLVADLIERLTLPVPQVLIEAETEDIMQDMQNMLSRERIDMTRYLQLMGKNVDEYRQELHPEAVRRIKQRRALELLAEREGMDVTTAEIQEVIDAYNSTASGTKRMRLSQLRASQRLSIERSLLRDKAQDWMMQHLTDATASVTMESDATATLAVLGAESEGTPAQHVVEATAEVTSSATTPATEATNAS